eukprot:NODE_3_length_80033_cov_0.932970.p46 type:complete len:223 gc:universal NODE_3_length_80033_cov_0.932970:26067-25399(-)
MQLSSKFFENFVEVKDRRYIKDIHYIKENLVSHDSAFENDAMWFCSNCYRLLPFTDIYCRICDERNNGYEEDQIEAYTEIYEKFIVCSRCGLFINLEKNQELDKSIFKVHLEKQRCGIIMIKDGFEKKGTKWDTYNFDYVVQAREASIENTTKTCKKMKFRHEEKNFETIMEFNFEFKKLYLAVDLNKYLAAFIDRCSNDDLSSSEPPNWNDSSIFCTLSNR